MEHIELFAGCGGLSLGLESSGFELFFANEISPMAAETFSYNLLGEDLQKCLAEQKLPRSTLFLNSHFKSTELTQRLRENPMSVPELGSGICDLKANTDELKKKMIVGNIIELNEYLLSNPKLAKAIKARNIDLVSGGPPCQSFSLAGLRQLNNARNMLPMEFANFVEIVSPKIVMLENVSGILRPFNQPDGKHYAWFEVARVFVSKGYIPICLHVNAKYAGAAQNRPRFILLAFRKDVFKRIFSSIQDEFVHDLFKSAKAFFDKEIAGEITEPFKDIICHEIEKGDKIFETEIFSPLFFYKEKETWFTVRDAIDDLKENNKKIKSTKYTLLLDQSFAQIFFKDSKYRMANHEHRANSEIVRSRFKLYQQILFADKNIYRDILLFLKNPQEHTLKDETLTYLLSLEYLVNGSIVSFKSKKKLLQYLELLKTKKQTQRALNGDLPAPAALSIPDDACHYDNELLRTLTVREMARIQSFPDWFEFRSKVTTGGQMRKFEVPQYTQVGNAVPPLLGKALGKVVSNFLKIYSN